MQWKGKLNKGSLSVLFCTLLLVLNNNAVSGPAEEFIIDDEFDFFDNIEQQPSTKNNDIKPSQNKQLFVKGYLKQKQSYSIHNRSKPRKPDKSAGESQRRTVIDVTAEGELKEQIYYRINANVSLDKYNEVDDDFEWREVYLNLETVDNLWLKFGRQIISWGESNYTQILDQANPRDNREIGLVDAEDARLPVWATKLSHVGDRWGTDLVLIHEFRANKDAEIDDDFDRFITFRNNYQIEDAIDPDVSFSNPEVILRLFLSLPKGDVSLIYAKVFNDTSTLREGDVVNQLEPYYAQMEVFGLSGNWINDQWLYKFELAQKHKVPVQNTIKLGTPTDKVISQFMMGAEYALNVDTDFEFEWVAQRIEAYNDSLKPAQTQISTVSKLSFDMWHDTAQFVVSWGHMIQANSDIVRVSFDYDYTDNIKLGGGYLNYHADNDRARLFSYQDDDRLYFSVRYSF